MSIDNPPALASASPGRRRDGAGSTAEPADALTARLRRILSLHDFEAAARSHLPRPIFGYVSGAAEDNHSLQGNRAAFDDYQFATRVLVDISGRSTAVTLFGKTYAAPVGIAPVGLAALSAYRGDIALACAAARANVPMVMSGSSLIPLEQVAAACPDAWFQAYLPGDTERIAALIERVARAGYGTLVITVDTPAAANRENNVRAGFSTPLRPTLRLAWDGISHPRWLFGTFLKTLVRHGMPHFENSYATRGAPIMSRHVERDFSDRGHLNWEHFTLIRRMWKSPLIIKGILSAQDARIARDHGADGIIVSNHGGRQLDGAVAPLRVLPDVVAACPELPVMMDSGVRRGADVLKAMALGARMVFAGRPFVYAAAVAGEAGVAHAIGILKQEVSRNMAMLGIARLDELDARRFLVRLR
jgi:L-lactate dehydrogenase (cytochrome)